MGQDARTAEVVERLERGERWDEIGKALGMSARELILAVAGVGLDVSDRGEILGPELVQAEPARPKIIPALKASRLLELFPHAIERDRQSLAAGLLQIHDAWDASHDAAQAADDQGESRDAPYWHAIAHRREPDAGNALYWVRRVGSHPLYKELPDAAESVGLSDVERGYVHTWLGKGTWSGSAMVDFCTRAPEGSIQARVARKLQRLEMAKLLEGSKLL